MQQQALLNALSEFLMVEQCGLQLYTLAASRSTDTEIKQRYEEFLGETAHHREVLVGLIGSLGGDPNYVSPTARVIQYKSAKLLEASLIDAPLSRQEAEANDLENVLLAETKDHADWSLLQQLVQNVDDPAAREAIQAAVDEVESEEDEHLQWARDTLAALRMQLITSSASGQHPDDVVTSPALNIEEVHPAVIREGLLEGAAEAQWGPSVVSRAMGM